MGSSVEFTALLDHSGITESMQPLSQHGFANGLNLQISLNSDNWQTSTTSGSTKSSSNARQWHRCEFFLGVHAVFTPSHPEAVDATCCPEMTCEWCKFRAFPEVRPFKMSF